jgi:ABC-type glycerol-3-phosphate transport system substrate-binding protein
MRTFRLLSAFLLTLLVLPACARRAAPERSLTLSSWGDLKEAAILGDLCRMFEKENPGVKVVLQRVPYAEYGSKLMSQFVAGIAPDVLFVGSEQVVEYHPRGVLEPLNDYVARDKVDLKAYYPETIEPYKLGGVLYGMPRDIAPIACVFYNKDLFAKHGVAFPRDDWDWGAFLDAARKLTVRGADGKMACWGYTEDWLIPEGWFMSLGTDWVDDWKNPARYTFTHPDFVRGLQFRADLMYKYRVSPDTNAVMAISGGTTDLFMSGKSAMFLSGIWKSPLFRGIQAFDWDVAMFPKGPTGKRGFVSGGSGYGICSQSRKKDLAWKLVRFLTGEKGQEVFARTGLAQPAMMKVAASPAFLDGQKPLNKGMLLKAVAYGKNAPCALNWREVLDSYIRPTLDRVWNGQWTAQQGIDELARKLKDKPLIPAGQAPRAGK